MQNKKRTTEKNKRTELALKAIINQYEINEEFDYTDIEFLLECSRPTYVEYIKILTNQKTIIETENAERKKTFKIIKKPADTATNTNIADEYKQQNARKKCKKEARQNPISINDLNKTFINTGLYFLNLLTDRTTEIEKYE